MAIDQELYQTLQRYRTEQLSAEERADFEAKMAQDAVLADAVREYDQLQQTIMHYGDQQLEVDLSQLGAQLMQATPREAEAPVRSLRSATNRVWLVAAAIVVLAGLSYLFWPRTQLSPEAMFAAHFEPKTSPSDRGSDANEQFRLALDQYDQENYLAAIDHFEAALADSSFQFTDEAKLYVGISYLATQQSDEGIAVLGQVSQDSYDKADANWYLALGWLQKGDKERGLALVEQISKQARHPYQEQAQKLWDAQ